MKANDSKVYQIFSHIAPFFPILPHIAPFSDPLDSMHAYARVERNDNYLMTEGDIP